MLELEKQYKSGELSAFGTNASKTFAKLDSLRKSQQQLFHKHIELEKEVLAELGNEVPEVDQMESEGFKPFGSKEASQTTQELLSEMSALAKQIQATAFHSSVQVSTEPASPELSTSKGMPDATLISEDVASKPSAPLTKEALEQLQG